MSFEETSGITQKSAQYVCFCFTKMIKLFGAVLFSYIFAKAGFFQSAIKEGQLNTILKDKKKPRNYFRGLF